MMTVIDDIAREVRDPQIAVHVSNMSSAVESVVRVSISFIAYENPKYVVAAVCHCNNCAVNCCTSVLFTGYSVDFS